MSRGNCVSKIFWHCIQGKQIFIGYHSNRSQRKFSSIHIKVFFMLMLFLQTKTFEHEICFLEDFLLFALPWQRGPAFEHIPTFFYGSVNFRFISIYRQIFKVALFYLPKIYCFRERGAIMKSSYVIHPKSFGNLGTKFVILDIKYRFTCGDSDLS